MPDEDKIADEQPKSDETEDKKAPEVDVAALQRSVTALEGKNQEILSEKKKLADQLKAVNAEKAEREAEATKAAEEAAEKAGDVDKLREQLEAKHAKEREALQAKLDEATALNHKLLVDDGLSKALSAANVRETMRPAVAALLKSASRIEIADGEARMDSQPLADAVALWAESDAAKEFIKPTDASGADAKGGTAAPTAQQRSKMTSSEKRDYQQKYGREAFLKLPA